MSHQLCGGLTRIFVGNNFTFVILFWDSEDGNNVCDGCWPCFRYKSRFYSGIVEIYCGIVEIYCGIVEIYCGIAEIATMCLLWVPQQTQVRGLFGHS